MLENIANTFPLMLNLANTGERYLYTNGWQGNPEIGTGVIYSFAILATITASCLMGKGAYNKFFNKDD